MTTITTADLRRAVPRRTRRNLIAALVAAALLAPTALIVSRTNDNDSHRIAAPTTNLPFDPRSIDFLQPEATPVAVAPLTEVVSAQAAAAEVCRGGLEWACAFTPQIVAAPSGTASVAEAAAEVCRGGLEWACAFTPQLEGQN